MGFVQKCNEKTQITTNIYSYPHIAGQRYIATPGVPEGNQPSKRHVALNQGDAVLFNKDNQPFLIQEDGIEDLILTADENINKVFYEPTLSPLFFQDKTTEVKRISHMLCKWPIKSMPFLLYISPCNVPDDIDINFNERFNDITISFDLKATGSLSDTIAFVYSLRRLRLNTLESSQYVKFIRLWIKYSFGRMIFHNHSNIDYQTEWTEEVILDKIQKILTESGFNIVSIQVNRYCIQQDEIVIENDTVQEDSELNQSDNIIEADTEAEITQTENDNNENATQSEFDNTIEISEHTETAELINNADIADVPEIPDELNISEIQDIPNEQTNMPDMSDGLEIPEIPDILDMHEISNIPDIFDNQDILEVPEIFMLQEESKRQEDSILENQMNNEEYQNEFWKCEQCGYESNQGKFCKSCGSPKPETRDCDNQEAAENNKTQMKDSWECIHCGTINTRNFCYHCGAKKPIKKKNFRCAKCGWMPDVDETFEPVYCPECGDKIEEDDIFYSYTE